MATPKKKQPLGQTIGGVLFGFEQQVLRNQPPPHELVHHARPDNPVAAGDGGFVTIDLPDDEEPAPSSALGLDPGRAPDPVMSERAPEGDEA